MQHSDPVPPDPPCRSYSSFTDHGEIETITGRRAVFIFFLVAVVLGFLFHIPLPTSAILRSRHFTRLAFAARNKQTPSTPSFSSSPAGAENHSLSSLSGFHSTTTDPARQFRCPPTRWFTKEEVSRHTKLNDLWIVVYGNVLDVTAFVKQHPGGAVVLQGAAGGEDAGTQFSKFHHSSTAKLFSSFCIGRLQEAN